MCVCHRLLPSCLRVMCVQLPVEVGLQEQRGLFYPQTFPETTHLDRPVSTPYLCPESLVSRVCQTKTGCKFLGGFLPLFVNLNLPDYRT